MADRVAILKVDEDLADELQRLKLAVVRRLRKKLEGDDPATPAYLDVARKLLQDMLPPQAAPRARPVVEDLPFEEPDEG